MMGINLLAVLLATIAQFIIGAIWYMPVFGKKWGEIHGFDMSKLSKEEQKKAQKQMMPMLAVQFLVTILTSFALAKVIALAPDYSAYKIALVVWLGFFVPVQVADVLFGGTDSKWIVQKIAILSGGSLLCLLAAAAIISNV